MCAMSPIAAHPGASSQWVSGTSLGSARSGSPMNTHTHLERSRTGTAATRALEGTRSWPGTKVQAPEQS